MREENDVGKKKRATRLTFFFQAPAFFIFDTMYHPTYTPTNVMPREEKGRNKSPPRVAKPSSLAAASAARPVPLSARVEAKPIGSGNGDRLLAHSFEKSDTSAAASAGAGEEGLGGEPFGAYCDDVRELVAALCQALKQEEDAAEGGGGGGGGGDEEECEKLSEVVSVTRAFFHQQLRLAGDAERRSLAELKSAVQPLLLLEERKEERRRRRNAGAEGGEAAEEEEAAEGKKREGRLSAELAKAVRRGLDATLAVLLVEEDAAREKGLLH